MVEGYQNSDDIMERGVLLHLHHGLTDSIFYRLHETIGTFISESVDLGDLMS